MRPLFLGGLLADWLDGQKLCLGFPGLQVDLHTIEFFDTLAQKKKTCKLNMDPKQKQNIMKFAIIHFTILVLNFRDANIHETREKGVPRSTKHREYHLKDEHVLKRAKSSEAPQFSMSGKTSTKSWLHFPSCFHCFPAIDFLHHHQSPLPMDFITPNSHRIVIK